MEIKGGIEIVDTLHSIGMKKEKEQNTGQGSEKRTFIFLLLLTCVALVAIAILLYLVPYVGFSNIYHGLPIIMAIVFAAVVLFLIGGGLTLIFTIIRGKNLFFNRRIRGVVIRFLFPLLVLVGNLVGKSKDQVKRAFVAINNQLVANGHQVCTIRRTASGARTLSSIISVIGTKICILTKRQE